MSYLLPVNINFRPFRRPRGSKSFITSSTIKEPKNANPSKINNWILKPICNFGKLVP